MLKHRSRSARIRMLAIVTIFITITASPLLAAPLELSNCHTELTGAYYLSSSDGTEFNSTNLNWMDEKEWDLTSGTINFGHSGSTGDLDWDYYQATSAARSRVSIDRPSDNTIVFTYDISSLFDYQTAAGHDFEVSYDQEIGGTLLTTFAANGPAGFAPGNNFDVKVTIDHYVSTNPYAGIDFYNDAAVSIDGGSSELYTKLVNYDAWPYMDPRDNERKFSASESYTTSATIGRNFYLRADFTNYLQGTLRDSTTWPGGINMPVDSTLVVTVQAMPEPTSIALLAMGSLAIIRRRRK